MAIRYGEDRAVDFASGNLMTFAKSFSAMNGQPLDNREVWYDKDALIAAAAGSTMYVGQKVSYIDVTNQKVYQYSVQLDGTLKEIGVAPVSDGATIAVNPETGVVSLYGVAGLDANKTYVPSIVNGVLTWAEPDTSTAEGQQQAIDGLTTRMKTAEAAIDAVEVQIGDAENGLVKDIADNKTAIETEAATARAAEKANADAIDAVETRLDTVEGDIEDIETALADRYTKAEANEKIAEEIGKQAHFSAKVVTSEEEMTDATTLYLVKVEGAEGADVYNQYIVIEGVPTLIGDTTTDLSDYATTEAVNTAIASAVSAAKTEAAAATQAVADDLAIEVEARETLATNVAETYATKEALATTDEAIGALQTRAGTIEAAATALTGRVKANEDAIAALGEVDEDHTTRIAALEEVGSEKNVITAVSSEFTLTSDTRTLGINAIASDKITGLADALAGKVNVKSSEYKGEQVEWTLVSPENQEKLKALVIGEDGVEISGTVNADNVEGLGSYITENRNSLGGLYPETDASKLLGIEAGAQINVIEGVTIAGTAISVTDKIVNIPMAGLGSLGIVMGCAAENGIAINADGTMKVNSINVNKLVQSEDDELILNGGNA